MGQQTVPADFNANEIGPTLLMTFPGLVWGVSQSS